MRRMLITAILALLLTSTAGAADTCTGRAKIDDTNRKFSVFVPRSAGLGEQSYDDIGCAVLSRNEECASRAGMFDSGAVAYDYLSGEEMPVEKMFFAMRTDVKTPQGYGIVAFKDRTEAEKFALGHGKGKVVKWFELVEEKLKE